MSSLGGSPFSHGLKGCHTLSRSSESRAPRLLIVKSIFSFTFIVKERDSCLTHVSGGGGLKSEEKVFAGEPSWTTLVVAIQEGTSLKRDIIPLYQTCRLPELFVICEGQSTRFLDYQRRDTTH